jgi:uncharacterized phage infection (PIP) family protein YhgE
VEGKKLEVGFASASALLGLWAALRKVFACNSADSNAGDWLSQAGAHKVYDMVQELKVRVEASELWRRDTNRDLTEMRSEFRESLAKLAAQISTAETKVDVVFARTTEIGADLKLLSPKVAMLEEESQLRRQR